MTFQAYIDTIKLKTGKTPENIKQLAEEAKILYPDMKANVFVDWLKNTFQLGHGHCMALWALFVSKGWIVTSQSKIRKVEKKVKTK